MNTIGNVHMPFFVVATLTGFLIQVATDDRCIKYFCGFVIFKLVQAAAGTSIAQALPFVRRHLVE